VDALLFVIDLLESNSFIIKASLSQKLSESSTLDKRNKYPTSVGKSKLFNCNIVGWEFFKYKF